MPVPGHRRLLQRPWSCCSSGGRYLGFSGAFSAAAVPFTARRAAGGRRCGLLSAVVQEARPVCQVPQACDASREVVWRGSSLQGTPTRCYGFRV